MAIRFYIMPLLTVGIGRGAKYLYWRFNPTGIFVARHALLDYGKINACIVMAEVTPEQHDAIMLNDDVASPPENLDLQVTVAALPKVQTVLEAMRIPADWVDTTYTYRQLLRKLAELFRFAMRYHVMHHEELIDNPGQLDLQWNQIPLARRERVLATADDMGYDYSAVQVTWLVRRILKHMADQWGNAPIKIGSFVL